MIKIKLVAKMWALRASVTEEEVGLGEQTPIRAVLW